MRYISLLPPTYMRRLSRTMRQSRKMRRLSWTMRPKAITATAHKLARIFYCLWRGGGEDRDPGVDVYEQQYQQRILKNLQRKADQLGFTIVPQPDSV